MGGPCGKNIEFRHNLINRNQGGMVAEESFEPVRVGYMEIADHLAVKISDQMRSGGEGKSEKGGFETVSVRSFRRMADALADREIQAALLPLPAGLDLFGRGVDIRLLLFVNREGGTLLYNRKAGIGGLKGFAGKSVLVPSLLSVESMLLHWFLTKAGLKVGKGIEEDGEVRMAEISPHLMTEVVEQDTDGDVAGFVMPEPFAGRALETGIGGFLLHTGSLWPCHPSSVLVVDRTVLHEYPNGVRSFTSGLEEAGGKIARSSETEFADFTDSVFGTRLGPENPVTQKRGEMFSPRMFPPEPDTIRAVMTYMAGRMDMADWSGKTDDFIRTGWCGGQENRDSTY